MTRKALRGESELTFYEGSDEKLLFFQRISRWVAAGKKNLKFPGDEQFWNEFFLVLQNW